MTPRGIAIVESALAAGYTLRQSTDNFRDWTATAPDGNVLSVGINEWCSIAIALHAQGVDVPYCDSRNPHGDVPPQWAEWRAGYAWFCGQQIETAHEWDIYL